MDISATSNLPTRSVTASRSSGDRSSNDGSQAINFEAQSKERAQEQRVVQEQLKQHKDASERRLDGRLISFGPDQGHEVSQQKQASYNRSRVNEAYSPPKEVSHNQNNQQTQNAASDAIDIVV